MAVLKTAEKGQRAWIRPARPRHELLKELLRRQLEVELSDEATGKLLRFDVAPFEELDRLRSRIPDRSNPSGRR